MPTIRTSQTHPLQIAEVRAGPTHGRIGITFCPGKQDRLASTGIWLRDLATDLDAIAHWGAKVVVTLVETCELKALAVPHLGQEIEQRGMIWLHLPIADYSVPSPAFEKAWIRHGQEIRTHLRRGEAILVHCKGGLGRAGMIAARLLAELGVPAEEAIKAVRKVRKGAIETQAQLALVRGTRAIADEVIPLDTAALQRIGGQLGSNPGGIYEDRQGQRYYIKTLESPAYARNEYLAAALYRLAGAPTLHYVPTTQADQVATILLELEKKSVAQLSEAERRQAQQWFGVHAWTANWDAAGFLGDNQGVAAGCVITLDLGGALAFRAMGDPKGKAFGVDVGELETLRQSSDNPFAIRLFADMNTDALRAAIAVVTRIPDDQIRQTILEHQGSEALADKMIARKADMQRHLSTLDERRPA